MTTTSKNFVWDISNLSSTLYNLLYSRNSSKIRISLHTLHKGTEVGYTRKEGTCYVKNSNPSPINFKVTNINDVEITSLVTGYGPYNDKSNIKIKIPKLSSISAKNGAKLTKIVLNVGNFTNQEIKASDLLITDDYLVKYYIDPFLYKYYNELKNGGKYISLKVVDSRGNSTETRKFITLSKFVAPFFTKIETKRNNGIDTKTKLIAKGKFQGLYIRAFYNQMLSVHEVGDEIEIDSKYIATDENGNFSINTEIQGNLGAEGFSVNKEYDVPIKIYDNNTFAMPIRELVKVRVGKPLVYYHKNGVSYGKEYDETVGGSLQVDGRKISSYIENKEVLAYINGWKQYTGWDAIKYYEEKGRVYLSGMAGGGNATSAKIGYFSEKFRPKSKKMICVVYSGDKQYTRRATVDVDGSITVLETAEWVNFDNASFDLE